MNVNTLHLLMRSNIGNETALLYLARNYSQIQPRHDRNDVSKHVALFIMRMYNF